MQPPLCGVRRAPARRHLGSGPRRWCHDLAAEGEAARLMLATKEVGLTRGTAIVHAVSMMNLARHCPPLPRRRPRSPLVHRRRRLVFLLPLAPGGAIVLAQHRWSCPRLRLVRRQTKTTTLPNLQTSTLR